MIFLFYSFYFFLLYINNNIHNLIPALRFFCVLPNTAHSIGFILVTILAMFLPDRRVLTTAMASIYALNLLYMHAIPESPVWSLTKSRFTEARRSIASLSETLSVDGKSQVDNYIRRLSNASQRRRSSIASAIDLQEIQKRQGWRFKLANSSLGKLFKGRLIRKFVFLALPMHTSVSIADLGSKYYVSKLPGNIYFNSCS